MMNNKKHNNKSERCKEPTIVYLSNSMNSTIVAYLKIGCEYDVIKQIKSWKKISVKLEDKGWISGWIQSM